MMINFYYFNVLAFIFFIMEINYITYITYITYIKNPINIFFIYI